MNSPESFYLHLSGAQQGPYTIPQIDHLLNSGLIGVETLYWCEGLDQWQPVTSLVALRVKPRRWVKPAIILGIILALSVPARIFGPMLVLGWNEAFQHSFTASAAYWKARDVVRTEMRAKNLLVYFAPQDQAHVELVPPGRAVVRLPGGIVNGKTGGNPMTWEVQLRYERAASEWSGESSAADVKTTTLRDQ